MSIQIEYIKKNGDNLETKCSKCDKPAITVCSKCNTPLCEDHTTHGVSSRTNLPTTDCYGCSKKFKRKSHRMSIYLAIGLVIGIIIILLYLNTIFSFF